MWSKKLKKESNSVRLGGAPVEVNATQSAQSQQPRFGGYNQADIEQNKVMAVVWLYFGILVLIPIFAAKESKFGSLPFQPSD